MDKSRKKSPSQMALMVKNLPANARDKRDQSCSFSHWVRKIPGGRHGHPLQYSCLEYSMDRGAYWATVHRVKKSQTQLKRLSMHAYKKKIDGNTQGE